jgi:hypothetical protein
VDRVQALARRHRWVLRLDVVKHFPSLDHAILRDLLWRRVTERGLRRHVLLRQHALCPPVFTLKPFPGPES